jgi:transcriptional regulator with XRE-family HTH domain
MTDSFGNTLRRLRLEAGVGLRELARLIDKSAGYISDVEQGNVPAPSEEVILKIAGVLQADKNELLKAALKVDPEISSYVAKESRAADFLRMAKEKEFDNEDWAKLSQLAEIANLGKKDK